MSAGFDPRPGRLNGWKEIARHVGKGTRTVQRWERLYGLPVHRVGREGGEIVYALRDEIDRWLVESTSEREVGETEEASRIPGDPSRAGRVAVPAPPVRANRLGRWWLAAALLVAVAGTAGLVSALRRPRSGSLETGSLRQPTAWRLAGDSLTVLDEAGGVLFVHRFGFPLSGPILTSESPESGAAATRALIVDVDADGRSEVLVAPNAVERAERRLYCFEADGSVRFVHQPGGTRRFGNEEYGEPWLAHHMFSTRGADGTRRIWAVFTHSLLFPSVLRELDPHDGGVLQEYWSNGYIEVVREDNWAGRSVVLVGATNNDFRAASLAVFAPDGVRGSAPAARAAYECRDCGAGGPEAFFLFPTLWSGRLREQASVLDVWVEGGDRLRVAVAQGTALGASYYMLGPDGAVLAAEISHEFRTAHARLEREGVLDHPFGPRDERSLFPVRRWDGRRFVDLPPVPVGR